MFNASDRIDRRVAMREGKVKSGRAGVDTRYLVSGMDNAVSGEWGRGRGHLAAHVTDCFLTSNYRSFQQLLITQH